MKKILSFIKFYIFLSPFWMMALIFANILVIRLYKHGEFHLILVKAEPAVEAFRKRTARSRWIFSGIVWGLLIFFVIKNYIL